MSKENRQWLLIYRISYTDGVNSTYEEVFESETPGLADKYAAEFLKKEHDPMNGVRNVRLIELREYKD